MQPSDSLWKYNLIDRLEEMILKREDQINKSIDLWFY